MLAQDTVFIDKHIIKKQKAGHYFQSFDPTELQHLIGFFYTSLLGLVPKLHFNKFRIIQDLSYPHNDLSIQSVNAGVNLDDFPIEWGTFDVTVEIIQGLPSGC